MADYKIRPDSYNDGRGPQAGTSDLTTAVSGNAHYNTVQENVGIKAKARQMIKADPTDDAHETTHRGPASNDSIYSTVPSDDK